MAKVREFSTILKEEAVVLIGKDNEKKDYLIRELTGVQRQQYNDQFDIKIEADPSDLTKPKMITGDNFKMWSSLDFVSRCLYEKGKEESVGIEFVSSLPGTILKDLSDIAQELSGLDKESLEKAKNELEANTSSG